MNSRIIFGGALILLGVFLFMNRGESMGTGTIFAFFWPTIFIVPAGLFFHWLYFSVTNRKGVGLLIPGGILLTVGLVCQISTLFNGWEYMWPGFIMAPAVGLFEFYWFGSRHRGLLIPIKILTVISAVLFAIFSVGSFLSFSASQPIIAISMILAGAVMLFMRSKGA